jgi:hypothetical protein
MMRIDPSMLKIFKINMLYDAGWSHNVKNLQNKHVIGCTLAPTMLKIFKILCYMMHIGPTMLKIFKINMLYDAHWSHNVKNLQNRQVI